MKYKILVINNDPVDREVFEKSVEASMVDCKFSYIQSTNEDIQKISQQQPDILIFDDQNDDQPLYEVFNRFRKQLSESPIYIGITSSDSTEIHDKSIKAGAIDCIIKPFQEAQIVTIIRQAVELVDIRNRIKERIKRLRDDFQIIEKLITRQVDLPFALMAIEPTGQIEWANEGFTRIYGFDLESYRSTFGNTVFSLPPAEETSALFNKCIKDRQPVEKICRIKPKTGETRWLQIHMTPQLNNSGLVEKIIAVEYDITAFKNREEQLTSQNKSMQEIAHGLESANSMLEIQKQEINQQKLTIEEEQQKSEKLLLNILPFEVARQLKSKGRAGTRQYKLVSVLFADFKGFSNISKTLDPKDLVSILDSYFATFDEIIGKHYIEKIKTIGDAYMCAGGLPLSNKSNPVDTVLAGLEIQHYMNTLNDTKVLSNQPIWELRIGIHTGTLVAGVVGKKRFAYDIWGDTVNIASRMEQTGHVGMVNVSGITYEYIGDFFECDYRGKIETKNLGKIDMYFVNRIKPEYSLDKYGILPNDVMINLVNKL
jgi:PAS domain S-box-containing protein